MPPSYSFLTLKPPTSKLTKAASTAYNPLSQQRMAPRSAAPDYGQSIGAFAQSNPAPQFAASSETGAGGTGTAGGGGGGVSFTNKGNPAFAGVQAPTISAANGIDWSSDPIYQQTQALVQSQIAAAQAQAIAAEKQNLIRYGSPELVSQVLGKQADQKTIDAARDNAFSTVAELGRWNTRSLGAIDSTTNRNNLYFSSTRGRDRGLQQEDLIRQQTRTGNQLQDSLTGIATGLMNMQMNAQMSLLGAAEGAYTRAMQAALARQYAPPPTEDPYGGGPQAGDPTYFPGYTPGPIDPRTNQPFTASRVASAAGAGSRATGYVPGVPLYGQGNSSAYLAWLKQKGWW